MNNLENHKELKSQIHEIDFSISDFLETKASAEFDFKPINDGLGFHKPAERKILSPLSSSEVITPSRQTNFLNRHIPQGNVSEAPAIKKKVAKSNQQKSVSKTLLPRQVFASLIDMAVVYVALLALSKIFVFAASIMGVSFEVNDISSYRWFYLPIYLLSWLSYSSLMTPNQTIGQSIAKIRFQSDENAFTASFIRSLIVMFSWICMGIPTLFDFQGKLSDSSFGHD